MAEKTPKRASNANKKANRAASWKRGEARKVENRKKNEKRASENDKTLAILGLERTVTTIVKGKRKVNRPDSPQRTARLAGKAEMWKEFAA